MIYFTSDTHFGHANIIKYCERPFSCIESMNAFMLEQINAVVKENDTLYHLGDFAWKESSKEIRDQIKCQDIHLIWGNHDKANIADLFSSNHKLLELALERQEIVLCHYPMRAWNRGHYGSWHLFGHVHGTLAGFPNGKSLDVGVDSHDFKPLSFEQLKRHFNAIKT